MQRILIASGNAKKLVELQAMCAGLPVELLGPADLPQGLPEVEEDAPDFLGNAAKKAMAFAAAAAEQVGAEVWAMADDSGLCVDALDGAPGVHSARFAGVEDAGRDMANNALLLARLDGLPPEDRGAAFRCVIAVAHGDQLLFAVEGEAPGRILEAPEGAGGFGYDPLFYHEASGCSFARLDHAAKAAVSHRGEAVAKLRRVLETVLPSVTR
jgi:XTP/dITP diphosphohydrolase